ALLEDSVATGVDGNQSDNSTANAGAAYVFTRSGAQGAPAWTQQAYLKASNTGVGDYFGVSVAVDGDTVVVGAYGESSVATGVGSNQSDNSASQAGAAYVFTRSGVAWTQQAYLKASNTGAEDYFGHGVAMDGDTVVVGAYGEDSAATGVGGNQADNSASRAGAAYVFTRSGATWSQQVYLKAANTGLFHTFGFSVAAAGDTVVVGARYEAGAAYGFTRSGGTWTQQAYLKAAHIGAGDNFGQSVAVSGDTVIVGSLYEDSAATGVNGVEDDNTMLDAGAVYGFTGVTPPALTEYLYLPLITVGPAGGARSAP
ncbi:MAG: integrin, partial [Herpetosiphonaceae bacterium]|nr:integrin [Herpetosiphonaceae bacterium]